MTQHFDYIVVGAGSSGATLATRLAQRIDGRVLLLEAGGRRENDLWIRVPIGLAKILMKPTYAWHFHTEPQTGLAGQAVFWPRGRLVGGSGSVNGNVVVRGDPVEFDRWRAMGNVGWGYEDVLPYFKRLESATIGSDRFRGRDGPISITPLAEHPNELSDAFLEACSQADIPLTPDYNGEQYEGAGYLQLSTKRGRRCSAASAYLNGLHPPNLVIEADATALRVLLDGRRAVGVEYERGGEVCEARASREVILSAGPVKSPQLLEMSGIGNGALLQELGIPVVHHLPGVGENLIDHVQSRINLQCTRPITMNDVAYNPLRQALMATKYFLTGHGLFATPGCTVHAMVKSSPEVARPDVKIQLWHMSSEARFETAAPGKKYGLDRFSGFSIGLFQAAPESRGYVHARSSDPRAHPRIDPRYLDTEVDRRAMLSAIRISRAVMQQPAMTPYIVRETQPGVHVSSDEDLMAYLRRSGQSSYHPVGSCKMGNDAMAVVDNSLKVHGIESLRVADSSIMPTMCAPNTNAASIMVGEKAADHILGFGAAMGVRRP